jgi:hypothetical protein
MRRCDLHNTQPAALDADALKERTGASYVSALTCKSCNSTQFYVVRPEGAKRLRLMCVDCLADIASADGLLDKG